MTGSRTSSDLGRRAAMGVAGGLVLLGSARSRIAAAAEGTLRVGLVNFPPNIRPLENTGSSQAAVKLMIYRGLLSYGADGRLQPEMAESWQADGAAAYRFVLRANAKFHNGDAVTAEDVKFTIEEILRGDSIAYMRPFLSVVERVEVMGPREGRIVLKEPSTPFPHLMASYHAPVLSAKKAMSQGLPVGTGPFRLAAVERGSAITVERFAEFYKPGIPRVSRIRFQGYGDENLRVAALEARDVDIIEGVPWQSMSAVEQNPRLRMDATVGPFMNLLFNTQSGPFTDARVRRAVAYAVKRDEVVRAATYGRGAPLFGLPFPAPFDDLPSANIFSYDPGKARQLLREAGVGNGFSATLLATSSPTLHQSTAEVVQQNLREIGIDVALRLPEWGTRVALGNRGQYEFAVFGTVAPWPDPDALAMFMGGNGAYTRSHGFTSARIDGLFQAGRQETDPSRRRQIYDDLQQAAAEECPIVWLSLRSQAFGMQASVQGFSNMPGSLTFYAPVSLEQTTPG
ncbi:ABC transporter substrate-binding protein [Teichococcus vastitatis]|uniref:ABC transporter substrate-binding protein n=1 Tax=Teichococcus vastitatis TaxID=2307076 RepID=A0ABS9W9S8_9PROT|nr:ABC transporter substrate-binding protein [Pseudoroseomonas vastitatis]MCI0755635.1 ABC transporter substrate-binding protein [Pseudoroseomonas vastitatis]